MEKRSHQPGDSEAKQRLAPARSGYHSQAGGTNRGYQIPGPVITLLKLGPSGPVP